MQLIRYAFLAVATFVATAGCARDTDRAPKPIVPAEHMSNVFQLGGEGSTSKIDNPVAVLPMPDGRFASIDGTMFELEVFAPDGRVLFRDGGRGDGPGEFRAVSTFFPIGSDSLGVWDPQLKRLSIFSKVLNLASSKTVDTWPTNGRLRIIGRLSSGDFVGLFAKTQLIAGSAGQFVRDNVTVIVGRLDSVPHPVVQFNGSRSLRQHTGEITNYIALPDDNPRAIAVCGDSIVTLEAATFKHFALSDGGKVQSSDTYDFSVPVTVADAAGRKALLSSLAEGAKVGDTRNQLIETLSKVVAEPLKIPRRPIIASSDEIWFLSGRDPISLEQRDSRGEVRQRILWSSNTIPLRIDPDRVIGMTVDSLGVQTIRVHARQRTADKPTRGSADRCGPTFVY